MANRFNRGVGDMYSIHVINRDGSRTPAICQERFNDGETIYWAMVFKHLAPTDYALNLGISPDQVTYYEMQTSNPDDLVRLPLDNRVFRSWMHFARGEAVVKISIEGLRLLVENWHPEMMLTITYPEVNFYDNVEYRLPGVPMFSFNHAKFQIVYDLKPGVLARQERHDGIWQWEHDAIFALPE